MKVKTLAEGDEITFRLPDCPAGLHHSHATVRGMGSGWCDSVTCPGQLVTHRVVKNPKFDKCTPESPELMFILIPVHVRGQLSEDWEGTAKERRYEFVVGDASAVYPDGDADEVPVGQSK